MSKFDYVVLAATGNIGRAVVSELQKAEVSVLQVVHSQKKADEVLASGGDARVVDIGDSAALRAVFALARRAFLLNPPADPKEDTDALEIRTAKSIAAAVNRSSLEKVLVVSTYGAQPGEKVGDLSVLFNFEHMIEATGVPAAINRGAYYFTNLDPLLEPARQGTIESAFPADLAIPMVSTRDLGKAAAARLTSSVDDAGVRYVEGPARHTFADVAAVFSDVLGHAVLLKTTPREDIKQSYERLGFSEPAADAFARMTKASIDGPELPVSPILGKVTLADHVRQLATTP